MSEALCPWSKDGRGCHAPARGGDHADGNWPSVASGTHDSHDKVSPPTCQNGSNQQHEKQQALARTRKNGSLVHCRGDAGAAALANRAEFCPRPEGELACDAAPPPLRCPQTHNTDPGRREAPVCPAAATEAHACPPPSRDVPHTRRRTRPSARGSAGHPPRRAWTEASR